MLSEGNGTSLFLRTLHRNKTHAGTNSSFGNCFRICVIILLSFYERLT